MSKSHVGRGLIAGMILGVAAGVFLKSPEGKKAVKNARTKAMKFQAKITKELMSAKEMTEERYADLVDDMMAYYMTSKEIAKTEAPEIKSFLLGKWKEIERQLKTAKNA